MSTPKHCSGLEASVILHVDKRRGSQRFDETSSVFTSFFFSFFIISLQSRARHAWLITRLGQFTNMQINSILYFFVLSLFAFFEEMVSHLFFLFVLLCECVFCFTLELGIRNAKGPSRSSFAIPLFANSKGHRPCV